MADSVQARGDVAVRAGVAADAVGGSVVPGGAEAATSGGGAAAVEGEAPTSGGEAAAPGGEPAVQRAVVDAAREGRGAVLATVVATRGSVPRHVGSKMVIEPGRGLVGTIGGGCGEADVIAAAERVVRTGEPCMVRVELLDAIESWSPAVCGGVMEVFVEPITAEAHVEAL